MNKLKQSNIEMASEKIIANHLFNPTDKATWMNVLIQDELSESDAKQAYKIAAHKYHLTRKEQKHKKSDDNVITKAAKYAGAGILTFVVGPWIYVFLVSILIGLLGLIFGI